jgi:hypothetical protein
MPASAKCRCSKQLPFMAPCCASRQIGISRRSLLRLIEEGKVVATLVAGRWAIAVDEVARQATYKPFRPLEGRQPPLLVVVPGTPTRSMAVAA